MQLQVWAQFSKKLKSTRQPTETPSAVLNVTLKKDTSMLNPTFVISGEPGESLREINYVSWNARFYFVEDCIFLTNNMAELVCTVDPLATYKGNILGYEAFVVRASAVQKPYLSDPAVIPANRKSKWGNHKADMPSQWSPGEGSYIIRVVGGGGTSSTGITSYCVNAIGLNHIVEKAFNSANYDFLGADEAIKSFFNPFQYIVSVQWLPLTPTALGSDQFEHIKLGWWDLGESYRIVTATEVSVRTTIKRPTLPDDFTGRDPRFTSVKLYLPGCGTYFLDPMDCVNDLHISYHIDVATGACIVEVFSSDTLELYGTFVGQVGANISIGQVDMNLGNVSKSIIQGLGSLLSGNVGGVLNGVADTALTLAQPTPSVNGANGSRGAIQSMSKPIISWHQFSHTSVGAYQRGNYVCSTYKLSEIAPGYVQTMNANLDVNGTAEEKRMINNYLDGGIFLE